ncbi:MAG TPA: ABC transporter ATP-binding protein [Segeticoccus sp.]|uniref:ABC transporter ATP-binding protein n=1 Tax=Segeticoccus sp. TaxID=2706531 RepID=UPI002D7EF16C|nr:ABC transporter ATP-binding protein [Segeticoccus sp.]HET8599868.1 ABC transporter ATP-binding protein [Segeticoccus sp.]
MSTSTTTEPTRAADADGAPFLSVEDLHVQFATSDGVVKAVDGVNFTLERGKTLGIVGESGSGKSVTSQSILRLHQGKNTKMSGRIVLDGEDLLTLPESRMRSLRGSKMAMIFQDPLSALHPYYTIGNQLVEAIRVHQHISKSAAKTRVVDMLGRVGIPNPKRRFDQYPHEFSGGMRQRAMIAMALVNDPSLLIADEPTTALDVTVQAQILELMNDLQEEFGSAIIMITHDLGVVADVADDVLVMYAGRCVEQGSVDELFYNPQMPYTVGLLASMPRLNETRKERLDPIPGNPPSLINPPSGCTFHPRCPYRDLVPDDLCRKKEPELIATIPGHLSRCHIAPEKRAAAFAPALNRGASGGDAE